MSKAIIQISNLTKDYGQQRGVFDINLSVNEGEVFGLIGTNGSGKTTIIRNLMGFIHPTSGNCQIKNMNCTDESVEIKKYVSYIPGEIAFPDYNTGSDFLKVQAKYLHLDNYTYMNSLVEKLQLDTLARLKSMSKGMKQKTAIVAALMGNKDILLLDEPTTGLDPLMRDVFLNLIKEQKKQGKTVFMSSHIFEEIEEVCDRVAMIKDGKIIDIIDLHDLRHWPVKIYTIQFKSEKDSTDFHKKMSNSYQNGNNVTVKIERNQLNNFLNILKNYSFSSLQEESMSLEKYFMTQYGKESYETK